MTNWTKEQEQSITLRNRNLLVSAAAGSGKTAVLVERIVSMLLDKEKPIDVENLLVVTFTEAAAAEMKERVRSAIDKELEADPDNEHLGKQSVLIYNAQISTIHGFCLNVIRNHFHEINIDPVFRIAEQGELKLIRQEVMDKLLEERYAQEENQDFLDFVEKFGGGRNDKGIEGKILKLYDYSMSTPNPFRWLEESIRDYLEAVGCFVDGQGSAERFADEQKDMGCSENEKEPAEPSSIEREGARFWRLFEEQTNQYLEDGIHVLEKAIKRSLEPDGPYMYVGMLESDLEVLRSIQRGSAFGEKREIIRQYKGMRLSSKKDEGVSLEKREAVKGMRNMVKEKVIGRLQKDYFYRAKDELLLEMASCVSSARVLVDLVKGFSLAFAEKKRKLNVLDFNDMEHLALKILTVYEGANAEGVLGAEEEGEMLPSQVAKEYQNQFAEIMIDEYQDSNLIQETILTMVSRQSRNEHNIFMVGDIKQSIYRFRLSVPELFMEKYNTYGDEDGKNQRIILHKNFRSRFQVLDSVNEIFCEIMQEAVGGIDYDEKVALYPGAEFEALHEGEDFAHDTELLLCEEIENGEELLIANRIKELLESGKVLDRETKEFRKVEYRDIVILLRSVKGQVENLASFLMERGIPVHYGSQEGYFDAYEVSVLLDYLRVINNGRQDIPLTAVLTSPFVGLTSEELVRIRTAFPELPFHRAVLTYSELRDTLKNTSGHIVIGSSSRVLSESKEGAQHILSDKDKGKEEQFECLDFKLAEKLRKFWDEINRYREMLTYLGIHDLLWKIVEESAYGHIVQGMPGGNQRKANVDMLLEKALAFESISFKGLFHFIRYIEELKKYEVDFGEANIATEQSDVVRIMSIHKSKGLEFPVVILAGMSKGFNTMDLKADMLIHPTLGIGLNAIDLEKRTVTSTILKNVMKNQIMLENLGEELRVLYVALTRAKEKLIMTGKVKEKDFLALMEGLKYEDGERLFIDIASAGSYLDWVLPVVYRENVTSSVVTKLYPADELEDKEVSESLKEELVEETIRNWDKNQVFDEKLRSQFLTQLKYRYPYQESENIKLKFTVSELKKREELAGEPGETLVIEEEVIPLLPKFLEEAKDSSGIFRGNAYHFFMENLDFKLDYEEEYGILDLKHLRDDLAEAGRMPIEMLEEVSLVQVMIFLQTDLAKRMREASLKHSLFKEQPFAMVLDAGEVYKENDEMRTIFEGVTLNMNHSMSIGSGAKEKVLIQGIIDLWFEEEDGIVVVDYKTDWVRGANELRERYGKQLKLYGQALAKLTGKPVKERLIYSFCLQEVIEI